MEVKKNYYKKFLINILFLLFTLVIIYYGRIYVKSIIYQDCVSNLNDYINKTFSNRSQIYYTLEGDRILINNNHFYTESYIRELNRCE